jgi:intracellular septation protein
MIKFLTEFAPLVAFFMGYKIDGIMGATMYMLVASIIGLALSYLIERKINTITLVSAILLSISAGLTIFTGNSIFIKMKPTVLYAVFAIIFLVTLFKGKPAVKYIIGHVISLKEERNWKALNLRCMIFFILMAIANELVWRSFDESTWVSFKVFGAIPLIFMFIILQIPYIIKHRKTGKDLA